jgi:colanic acid/amylovoran biosynthesis protein
MSEMKRIAIIGGTIWGNRGAEAMLVTTIGKVRELYPNAAFKIFSYYPKRDRALIDDPGIEVLDSSPKALVLKHFPFAFASWFLGLLRLRLPSRLLPRAIRVLRACDALLDVGGITFSDGREIFLPFNILTIWPAMLLGVPVVKMAQAVGPFKNPLNRFLAKCFLGKCTRVFARGSITANHLEELRLPRERWLQVADIAFLYRDEYSLTSENSDLVAQLEAEMAALQTLEKNILAVSPSVLLLEKAQEPGREYTTRILDIIQSTAAKDGQLHFLILPNATRQGTEQTKNNDLVAIAQIRKQAMKRLTAEVLDRITWVDFDINTSSVRKLIACCDVLITSRFHAMVAGLSLLVPTMVIGWGHKYDEVLAAFNMGRYSFDFDDPLGDAPSLIHELFMKKVAIREELSDKLVEVLSAAERQFMDLERILT